MHDYSKAPWFPVYAAQSHLSHGQSLSEYLSISAVHRCFEQTLAVIPDESYDVHSPELPFVLVWTQFLWKSYLNDFHSVHHSYELYWSAPSEHWSDLQAAASINSFHLIVFLTFPMLHQWYQPALQQTRIPPSFFRNCLQPVPVLPLQFLTVLQSGSIVL